MGGGLSDREHKTLQLEAVRFKHAGVKVGRIRELFGESETRYYARLDALLDEPAAVAAYPAVVRRLIRLRQARRVARSGAYSGVNG
ncbi:DUF3263 domain-containing protein [Nocardioides sp. cx-169]|uniref:DUF3263 domain-containing protein n=1 Tax=Nocardioides sp. cx-169 TaxID=2899080 RepID=UPI001E3135F5|nr:DUF3263 domain-containing protein [Nocardioides sp. cx-169]MCD4535623.1 DUF3263 domain-containing protein [Nocardioides sp. cx-169]